MTSETLTPATADGATERFDPLDCLDQRVLRGAGRAQRLGRGRYLEVEGPRRSLSIPLGDRALHIGRGLSADLRLDDMSVSRRHAIVLADREGARVLDDRSSNGTYLNGVPVQQARLEHGDVIAVGRFLLRYLEL